MIKDLKNQAPAIASTFVDAWHAQAEALDTAPLTYIDHLLSETVQKAPVGRHELEQKLRGMIPGMLKGTAVRLVRLKYPDGLGNGPFGLQTGAAA